MPAQSPPNMSAFNFTGSILDNLQADAPLQSQISTTLNAALKSQLAAAATAANLPALLGLLNAMPAADLAAAKDLSLPAFAQQQIDPMVSGDPAMKAAINSEIAKLPATGTVGTALNLMSPLISSPVAEIDRGGRAAHHAAGRLAGQHQRQAGSLRHALQRQQRRDAGFLDLARQRTARAGRAAAPVHAATSAR